MANRMRINLGKVSTRGSQRAQLLLLLTAAIFAGLALLGYIRLGAVEDLSQRQSLLSASQQALAQQIEEAAQEAIQGDMEAFGRLRADRNAFQEGLDELAKGVAAASNQSVSKQLQSHLTQAEEAWLESSAGVDRILGAQGGIREVRERTQAAQARLPQLGAAMQGAAAGLVDAGAAPAQVFQAGLRLSQLEGALGGLLGGDEAAAEARDTLSSSATELTAAIDELTTGARTQAPLALGSEQTLEEATLQLEALSTDTAKLQQLIADLQPVIGLLPGVEATGQRIESALDALMAEYRSTGHRTQIGGVPVGGVAVLLLAGLALLSLTLLALLALRDAQRREETTKHQSERDEQAILHLLDEMGDLADGDLTVQATVSEDKTGAIADAINYAIEALRGLVTTINETASKVTHSAQNNRAISMRLAEASSVQSLQITQASSAIQSLTVQIDDVARNAGESAKAASLAVDVAERGAQTVRDTITGMDAIREQIQETSKRIKRLGESSQEIGEIVELIDDIADQTNILALNAAMQAAMAGEAGRGFAVVADEVQRLAERSRNATKQIEVLVRTIQADTNEAVSSMEASTSGVVEGANLAENAGLALDEITRVSKGFADLTKRIADSSQRQSRQSAEINDVVQAIRGITEENTEGTRRAAGSVEELVNLAGELQRSVAGFRLP